MLYHSWFSHEGKNSLFIHLWQFWTMVRIASLSYTIYIYGHFVDQDKKKQRVEISLPLLSVSVFPVWSRQRRFLVSDLPLWRVSQPAVSCCFFTSRVVWIQKRICLHRLTGWGLVQSSYISIVQILIHEMSIYVYCVRPTRNSYYHSKLP